MNKIEKLGLDSLYSNTVNSRKHASNERELKCNNAISLSQYFNYVVSKLYDQSWCGPSIAFGRSKNKSRIILLWQKYFLEG